MSEITQTQKERIVTIANTNILVGMLHATITQGQYLSTRELKGRQKQDYTTFMNIANRIVKNWKIQSDEGVDLAEEMSDDIHDGLYDLREKTVKAYIKHVENLEDEQQTKIQMQQLYAVQKNEVNGKTY